MKVPLILFLLILTRCDNSRSFDITCLQAKYNNSKLSYFLESGFFDQKKVERWKKNINISFRGKLSIDEIKNLDSLILEIQPLIHPIKIKRVETNHNVMLYFTEDIHEKKVITMGRGFARRRPKWLFRNEISGAEIWINPYYSELAKRNTMRHELMHALGMEHPATFKGTILGGAEFKSLDEAEKHGAKYHKIGVLDSALVRILYDECVPIGLTKKEFEKQLNSSKQ